MLNWTAHNNNNAAIRSQLEEANKTLQVIDKLNLDEEDEDEDKETEKAPAEAQGAGEPTTRQRTTRQRTARQRNEPRGNPQHGHQRPDTPGGSDPDDEEPFFVSGHRAGHDGALEKVINYTGSERQRKFLVM
ncbi:hypothetical protein LTR28_013249 [Elasticomyces elasticus]|nr:hypothetical protein LTR28_013249 [Elasticomyces elasticus]